MATIVRGSGGIPPYEGGWRSIYSIDVGNSGFGKEGTCTIPAETHLALIWVHQQCSNTATTDGDCIWTITPTNCQVTLMRNKLWTGNNNSDNWYKGMQVFIYHVYIPGDNGATIKFKHRGSGNYTGSTAQVFIFDDASYGASGTIIPVIPSVYDLQARVESVSAFNQRYNQDGHVFKMTALTKSNGVSYVKSSGTYTGDLLTIENEGNEGDTVIVRANANILAWGKTTGSGVNDGSMEFNGMYNAGDVIVEVYRNSSLAEIRLIVSAVKAV